MRIFSSFLALLIISFFWARIASAMPIGSLLYRTSDDGLMYGFNIDELFSVKNGIVRNLHTGHVGIYVGQENGKHYVVEALSGGVVKNEAKYFVNYGQNEKYLGAKIPLKATPLERLKAVEIAKRIAELNLGYDFDFHSQKGPGDKQWTCVGLTEKVYESSDISNPYNLSALEYDPRFYGVDITPDGYDYSSIVNPYGDTVAKDREFSLIARRQSMLVPAPEIIGYDAGLEKDGKRYFFLPYTQMIQSGLKEVETDIEIGSEFKDSSVRAPFSTIGLVLKWSLINNPMSTVRQAVSYVSSLFSGKKENSQLSLVEDDTEEEYGSRPDSEVAYNENPSTSLPVFDIDYLSSEIVSGGDSQPFVPVENGSVEKKDDNAEIDPVINDDYPPSQDLPDFAVSAPKSSNVEGKLEKVKLVASEVLQETEEKTVALPNRQVSPVISPSASSTASSSKQAEEILPLLIRRIYAAGNDDWLEIYNPNAKSVDIKAAGYRLEKTKTAADPSIMLRFGEEGDIEYRFGSVIPAGQSLVVAGESATTSILSKAHAIAKHDNFNWKAGGYAIYLASGPVSSDSDPDILDKVGFGVAKYYEGLAAPAIEDDHVLWRKPRSATVLADLLSSGQDRDVPTAVDTDNNYNDFLLVPLIEESQLPPEEEGGDDDAPEEPEEDDEAIDLGDAGAIEVSELKHLWHFDECYGEIAKDNVGSADLDVGEHWTIGRFGCGLESRYNYPLPESWLPVGKKIDGNNFSFIFWMKMASNSSRVSVLIDGAARGDYLRFIFNPDYVQLENIPNAKSVQNIFSRWQEGSWHLVGVSFDGFAKHWGIFVDGEEYFSGPFPEGEILPTDFSRLKVYNDNGLTVIDDFAWFGRGLSAKEIKDVYTFGLPFTPNSVAYPQDEVVLSHFWDFNEAAGGLAADLVGGDDIIIDDLEKWIMNSQLNSSIRSKKYNDNIGTDFSTPLIAGEASLSFWWRNNAYPEEGRGEFALLGSGGNKIMSFIPSKFHSRYLIGGNYYEAFSGENILPDDNLWHNIVISYDRRNIIFRVYIDGEKAVEEHRLAWPLPASISSVSVVNQTFSFDFDDLAVWQGALSDSQAANIFHDGRIDKIE